MKLVSLLALTLSSAGRVSAGTTVSIWERLGGTEILIPVLESTVDRHFDDPLTGGFFGPHKFENVGDRDYVKKQVVDFFSAGTGGPYNYTGKNMIEAHASMTIPENAFHALAYHLLAEMESRGAGTSEDRDDVLAILYSLKDQVQAGGFIAGHFYDHPIQNFGSVFKKIVPSYLSGLPIPSSLAEFATLTLSDAWALLPLLVTLSSPLVVLQLIRKIGQSHDLEKNNSGIFQFSRSFYSGGFISALPFLLGLVPSLLAIFGAFRGGSFTYIVAVAGYILVPIVDLFLGEDSYNPTQEEEKKLKTNLFFRAVTWLYVIFNTAVIGCALYVIKAKATSLSGFELFGITLSSGISGGFGIGCVHELIHRPSAFELYLGIFATVLATYSHFWIEHLWGHHKRVATDLDPASSQLGDNIYTFWPRCIINSFKSAVDIESRFMKKKKNPWYSNRIFRGYAASAALATAAYHYAGVAGLAFFLGQGFIVALHIENANFIEHYGLRRRAIDGKFDRDGEPIYERPGWFHAWDTADRLTNWMLFKIQRHPDHHTNAGRPYQILRTFPQSPTMPTGYAGMFVLSWFPPLWWAIMDPLVERAYRQRQEMERRGVSASAFPKGSNNMSSFFKKEGEGYFESGSSPYSNGSFYESDVASKEKSVWDEDYNKTFAKSLASSTIVETHIASISIHAQAPENVAVEEKKHK